MKPEELERSFVRGSEILVRGSTTRELYIVRSGVVRLDWPDAIVSKQLAGGDLFGEIPAVLGDGSPYTALAEEDTVVLVLDLPLINRLCRESTEFAMRLIRHLAIEYASSCNVGAPPTGASEPPRNDVSRLAQVLVAALPDAPPPIPVRGALLDLARACDLPVLNTYKAVHALLDRNLLQLIDDQLSVVEPGMLRALIR